VGSPQVAELTTAIVVAYMAAKRRAEQRSEMIQHPHASAMPPLAARHRLICDGRDFRHAIASAVITVRMPISRHRTCTWPSWSRQFCGCSASRCMITPSSGKNGVLSACDGRDVVGPIAGAPMHSEASTGRALGRVLVQVNDLRGCVRRLLAAGRSTRIGCPYARSTDQPVHGLQTVVDLATFQLALRDVPMLSPSMPPSHISRD
jgi:hypothetical protein